MNRFRESASDVLKLKIVQGKAMSTALKRLGDDALSICRSCPRFLISMALLNEIVRSFHLTESAPSFKNAAARIDLESLIN